MPVDYQEFAAADVDRIRSRFPALNSGTVFFDNPGGTQVPLEVIGRMSEYLQHSNANHGGHFPTSQRSDRILAEAHQAAADFLNAASPREVIFGNNMTTLTLALSRSLAQWINRGDEIIVTRLDHDANVAPWLLLAEERQAKIKWLDVNEHDCTLKMDEFQALLSPRTRLVAVGYASNAVGTINPLRRIIEQTRSSGALLFVDAVHYAAHGSIDVQELDCDFLACSAYKFFGPHVGLLYGKLELLERLPAYKVRPAGDHAPDKFETGTQNHEGLAGFLGVIEYLEWLGLTMGWIDQVGRGRQGSSRSERLHQTMRALASHERQLSVYLIDRLRQIRGVKIWGITDPRCMGERVPTVSFTRIGFHPERIATALGEQDINVWSGHYYAVEIMRRLGVLDSGGMVRIGLTHYNTPAEVDHLVDALQAMRK